MNELLSHSIIQNSIILNLAAKLLFCLKVERHNNVIVFLFFGKAKAAFQTAVSRAIHYSSDETCETSKHAIKQQR